MKVLVLSDIHDHIWNLQKVVDQVKGKVEAVIFCGDFAAPFSAGILSQLDLPTYACLGNNDEDHLGLMKKGGEKFHWVALTEEFGQVELGGRKIAFCHYPKLGSLLAKTGDYDAVFYGHTHKVQNELIGKTLISNPGSVCGIIGGQLADASYALYDTEANSAEVQYLTDVRTVQANVVAGVIIRQNGKYLLVQEKQPVAHGLWNWPAGRVEKGKTIEETAIHEAKEETGYEVRLIREIGVFQEKAEAAVKHAFLAEIVGGDLQFPKDELLDARWLSLDEIKGLLGKLRGPWVLEAATLIEKS